MCPKIVSVTKLGGNIDNLCQLYVVCEIYKEFVIGWRALPKDSVMKAVVCSFSLHPPDLPEREAPQGSHCPSGYKKREELSFFSSVPPQGLERL